MLLEALSEHERRQKELRLKAGKDWQDLDLIFATRCGRPLNHCWYADILKKRISTAAHVRPISLHTFRKTGASLLELGRESS